MKRITVKLEFLAQSLVRYPFSQPCPHCRSVEQTLVGRKYGVGRIVRCTGCGLCFSRPIYRSWLASNFYDRLYSEPSTTVLPHAQQLEQLLAAGFRGLDKDASAVLEKIRAHVSSSRPRLLEIGSSWGYFLYQARAAGFDVTGVEIATRRRNFACQRLGLRMVADLRDLDGACRYDVIYAAHALEHFVDIHGVFPRLAALLSDDGVLFIEVPNFDPEQFGRRCFSIVGAVHPIGFDTDFLRFNLPRHGLEVTGLYASWDDLPDRPSAVSHGAVIIARAIRRRAEAASGPPRPRPASVGTGGGG